MANMESNNPIVQHVEKIVLGVCLLILIVIAAGVFSTSTHEYGGREIPLKALDEAILKTAEDKAEMVRNLPADDYPPLEDAELIAHRLGQPVSQQTLDRFPRVTPLRPDSPLARAPEFADWTPPKQYDRVDPNGVGAGGAAVEIASLLEQIPQPGAPNIRIAQECVRRGENRLQDRWVTHGAGVFDVATLLQNWTRTLINTNIRPRFAVAAVVIERQEQLPDGTWGYDGVAGASRVIDSMMASKDGQEVPAPDFRNQIPEYAPGKNSQDIRNVVNDLTAPAAMESVLQPDLGQIYWPSLEWGTWLSNLPRNPITDETGTMTRSEPKRTSAPSGTTGVPPADRDRQGRRPPLLPEDMTGPRLEPTMPPPGTVPGVRPPGVIPPTTTDTGKTGNQTFVEAPAVPQVPNIREQVEQGRVLVWFHDVTAEPQAEYRYRYRLILVSPLLTYDGVGEAGDKEEAMQRFVESPWSAWSEPAAVRNSVELFVTGGSELLKKVSITVFSQYWGQTVRGRFSLGRGDAIAGSQRVAVVDPLTGKDVKVDFPFQTGAGVVSLDFSKAVIKSGIERTTTEMLYVDNRGKLRRVISVQDMEPDAAPAKRYDELSKKAK